MNRYIAFLKVFERNSFSDAARDLGYTQSAVSPDDQVAGGGAGGDAAGAFALGRGAHL